MRELAAIRLRQAQLEFDVFDKKLKEAEAGKSIDRLPTKKTTVSEYYMQVVSDLLERHDLGLETKELHNLVAIITKKEVNYNTFRSYLNRMRQREKIYQDSRKRWHKN